MLESRWLSMGEEYRSAWFLSIYGWVGESDKRYTTSDPFVVASSFLQAIFVAPSCLVFAWTVYRRHHSRYILGVVTCGFMICLQFVYYAAEIPIVFKVSSGPPSACIRNIVDYHMLTTKVSNLVCMLSHLLSGYPPHRFLLLPDLFLVRQSG